MHTLASQLSISRPRLTRARDLKKISHSITRFSGSLTRAYRKYMYTHFPPIFVLRIKYICTEIFHFDMLRTARN